MAERTIRLFLAVSPIFEQAMGYRGACRWVSFYRLQEPEGLRWQDNPGVGGLQANTEAWGRFRAHPRVVPYLLPFDLGDASGAPRQALLLDRWARCFHILEMGLLNQFLGSAERGWPPADQLAHAHTRRMFHHMDGDVQRFNRHTMKTNTPDPQLEDGLFGLFSASDSLLRWYNNLATRPKVLVGQCT